MNNPIKKECSFKCMAIAVRNFLSPHFRASFQVTKKTVEIEKKRGKVNINDSVIWKRSESKIAPP